MASIECARKSACRLDALGSHPPGKPVAGIALAYGGGHNLAASHSEYIYTALVLPVKPHRCRGNLGYIFWFASACKQFLLGSTRRCSFNLRCIASSSTTIRCSIAYRGRTDRFVGDSTGCQLLAQTRSYY